MALLALWEGRIEHLHAHLTFILSQRKMESAQLDVRAEDLSVHVDVGSATVRLVFQVYILVVNHLGRKGRARFDRRPRTFHCSREDWFALGTSWPLISLIHSKDFDSGGVLGKKTERAGCSIELE